MPETAPAETPRSYETPQGDGNPYYNQQAAGPTYVPAPSPAPPAQAPWRSNERDRTILALILIGGGVLFLLGQLPFFPGFGDLILLLIGGVLMYAYFTTKPGYRIGFLIPGAILLGLGVGELIESFPFPRLWSGDITTITLGLGFCLIWFFERKHWWALIPGGILVLSGLSSLAFFGSLWPLALIALGVYLLYNQSRRR